MFENSLFDQDPFQSRARRAFSAAERAPVIHFIIRTQQNLRHISPSHRGGASVDNLNYPSAVALWTAVFTNDALWKAIPHTSVS